MILRVLRTLGGKPTVGTEVLELGMYLQWRSGQSPEHVRERHAWREMKHKHPIHSSKTFFVLSITLFPQNV